MNYLMKLKVKELTQFEGISEYTYNEHLYWVLYNGELNDDTFNSENVFMVIMNKKFRDNRRKCFFRRM